MYKKIALRQPTGAIVRQWRQEHQPTESAWAQLVALAQPPITRPPATPQPRLRTDQLPTVAVPVVQPRPITEPHQLPRFLKYRRTDNPLQQLYGAYLESMERFQQLPEAFYLAHERLQALIAQMKRLGQEYDGYFHVQRGGRTEYIPIFTSLHLPPLLKIALNNHIPSDCIIALYGPGMTSGRQEDFLL